MGLDSFLFAEKIGDCSFDIGGGLCGGMFSGDGSDGSFRGKAYNPLVEKVTGLSLYTQLGSPEFVAEIAEKLRNFLNELPEECNVVKVGKFEYTREEVESLTRLFEQAAEKGCKYCGWW